MYECRCISKHIHLEEDGNVLLGIYDVYLGIGLLRTLTWREKEMLLVPMMHYLTNSRA